MIKVEGCPVTQTLDLGVVFEPHAGCREGSKILKKKKKLNLYMVPLKIKMETPLQRGKED